MDDKDEGNMSTPKRPEKTYVDAPDFTVEEVKYIEEMRDHEHAVAKRAVRALELLTGSLSSHLFDDDGEPATCYEYDDDRAAWKQTGAVFAAAIVALREIEESGWKPTL